MTTFDFMLDSRHDLERDKALLVPLIRPVLLGDDPREANVVIQRISDNCVGAIRPRVVKQTINGGWQYVWTATHLVHEPDGDYIGYIVESSKVSVSDDRRGTRFEYHTLSDLLVTMDEMNVRIASEQT